MRPALLCILLLLGSSCDALSGGPSGTGTLKSVTPGSSGTPPNCIAIDWSDFVRHDGISYSASYSAFGRPITSADLGAERFRIKNTVSLTTCDPHYRAVDGGRRLRFHRRTRLRRQGIRADLSRRGAP